MWGSPLRVMMKKGPKMKSKLSLADALFRTFFATLSFMLILCWIWLTLGSLLAPVGSLLAPAGSLLAPFWLPLGPFWLTFGVPWLTFGALCFTFAHPGIHFLTFAVSCPHFWSFLELSTKIACKILILDNFLWKSHSRSLKSYFPEAHRTHPNRKYIFSCNPSFKARSGTFAAGNLDNTRLDIIDFI